MSLRLASHYLARVKWWLALIAIFVGPQPAESRAQNVREFQQRRHRLVRQEIVANGIKNPRVIEALRQTPRHEFVPAKLRASAYFDTALPIGNQQTISPPFVVAYMTEQLDPQPNDRVLEIGTGSGYQAAVLSHVVQDVYTIEIVEPLARRARRTFRRLKYDNIHPRTGDGFEGWPSAAPFDKIIVTCSPEKVPQPLIDQLRDGGRMIVPVGERYQQNLYLVTKQGEEVTTEPLQATLFVPMTGRAEQRRQRLPDPAQPTLNNGSFEVSVGETAAPQGWHYLRQSELIHSANDARDGEHYLLFKNSELGRPALALQGFAVDGRTVGQLNLRYWVRGRNLGRGPRRDQWPQAIVTFYNEQRAVIGQRKLGPYTGTFPWQHETEQLDVPLATREAILRIGLLGATGEIAFDGLTLRPVRDNAPASP